VPDKQPGAGEDLLQLLLVDVRVYIDLTVYEPPF
jgi:hypothetical protein